MPDSSESYMIMLPYKSTPPTVKELYLMDADGRNFRRLGDFSHHHSWVSDSKHVIFAGQKNEGLVYQAIDGSSRRVVSSLAGTHASVNPPLTHAVTDVYTPGPYMDYLVLIDLKDGRVEKLVKTPRMHPRTHGWTHPNPSWSRDGNGLGYRTAGRPNYWIMSNFESTGYEVELNVTPLRNGNVWRRFLSAPRRTHAR